MSVREFDLNVKKVLENWAVTQVVRELIANAIDEKALPNTKEIEIYKDNNGYLMFIFANSGKIVQSSQRDGRYN